MTSNQKAEQILILNDESEWKWLTIWTKIWLATKTNKCWNIHNIIEKRHLSLSQISKKNDDVGDNSLDGDLLRGMDSSTHHDMFASLITSNKLTVSTTRDVAAFLFFFFVFAHCAWRLFRAPWSLLGSRDIVPSERSAAVRHLRRLCYSRALWNSLERYHCYVGLISCSVRRYWWNSSPRSLCSPLRNLTLERWYWVSPFGDGNSPNPVKGPV